MILRTIYNGPRFEDYINKNNPIYGYNLEGNQHQVDWTNQMEWTEDNTEEIKL